MDHKMELDVCSTCVFITVHYEGATYRKKCVVSQEVLYALQKKAYTIHVDKEVLHISVELDGKILLLPRKAVFTTPRHQDQYAFVFYHDDDELRAWMWDNKYKKRYHGKFDEKALKKIVTCIDQKTGKPITAIRFRKVTATSFDYSGIARKMGIACRSAVNKHNTAYSFRHNYRKKCFDFIVLSNEGRFKLKLKPMVEQVDTKFDDAKLRVFVTTSDDRKWFGQFLAHNIRNSITRVKARKLCANICVLSSEGESKQHNGDEKLLASVESSIKQSVYQEFEASIKNLWYTFKHGLLRMSLKFDAPKYDVLYDYVGGKLRIFARNLWQSIVYTADFLCGEETVNILKKALDRSAMGNNWLLQEDQIPIGHSFLHVVRLRLWVDNCKQDTITLFKKSSMVKFENVGRYLTVTVRNQFYQTFRGKQMVADADKYCAIGNRAQWIPSVNTTVRIETVKDYTMVSLEINETQLFEVACLPL